VKVVVKVTTQRSRVCDIQLIPIVVGSVKYYTVRWVTGLYYQLCHITTKE
jgi:hypothetical protein